MRSDACLDVSLDRALDEHLEAKRLCAAAGLRVVGGVGGYRERLEDARVEERRAVDGRVEGALLLRLQAGRRVEAALAHEKVAALAQPHQRLHARTHESTAAQRSTRAPAECSQIPIP